MARQKRIALENTYYHIINRGVNNEKIFLDSEDRIYFLNLIKKGFDKNLAELITYSLMVTHYHLCAFFNLANISKALHYIEFRYAQYFNKKYNRKGHLFENRFVSIIVQKGEYFDRVIDYIHLNPIKSGMCKDIFDYRWSGLREIFDIENKVKIFKNHLSNNIMKDKNAYLNYLIELSKKEYNIELDYKYYQNNNGFYGSKNFINEKLKKVERRKEERNDVVFVPKRWSDRIKIAKNIEPEIVFKKIKEYYKVEEEKIKSFRILKRISFSGFASYILYKYFDMSFSKIAEMIKIMNKRSISNSVNRLIKNLENNNMLKKEIENILIFIKNEVK